MCANTADERSHAVVIGSGIGGLIAARVLADHFTRVTVLERDEAPEGSGPRRGVPQGHHLHVLLKAGERLLEELFPGFVGEIEERGALTFDAAADICWFHHGVWKARFNSGLDVHFQSRPWLESIVRERLRQHENIGIQYQSKVTSLVLDEARERVQSVAVQSRATQREEQVEADLVLDTSGRGSLVPRWLQDHGYAVPEEEQVGVDLQYCSRLYKAPDKAHDWSALIVYQNPPEETRGGLIFPVEDGRWMVTLNGYRGDHPPADAEGFVAFTRSLSRPEIYEAIREAEPLGEPTIYKFPYARWRHYERLDRFPRGLFVLGDAICSFDPVFGQGMAVVAMAAHELGALLGRSSGIPDPRHFFKSIEPILAVPWLLASCEDFRYPETTGKRPFGISLLQRYVKRVLLRSALSPEIHMRFLKVLHMMEKPDILFYPPVLLRLLGQSPKETERPLHPGRA